MLAPAVSLEHFMWLRFFGEFYSRVILYSWGCGLALFKVVGVVSRRDRIAALKLAATIQQELEKRGLKTLLEPRLAKFMKRSELATPLKRMQCDLIITVGGDGTILRVCLAIPKPEPPILAINMGARGFLAEVPPEKALEAVDRCLRGDYTIERCWKLSAAVGQEKLPDALNDIFITSKAPAKLTYVDVLKDGEKIMEYGADGLIIATQTGSTGYSLSAGGSILDPDVEAISLTPVAPLPYYRPLILPLDSRIEIRVLRPKQALIIVDGQYVREMGREKSLVILGKSEHETRFIRFECKFYARLMNRLFPKRGAK
ncbi:NAD(+) kinase [Candidatus Bathyarchaeota archaeon]|nr:MAG: NAD(+) kinase [Candidatus Bathyarchaeota archaeon]